MMCAVLCCGWAVVHGLACCSGLGWFAWPGCCFGMPGASSTGGGGGGGFRRAKVVGGFRCLKPAAKFIMPN